MSAPPGRRRVCGSRLASPGHGRIRSTPRVPGLLSRIRPLSRMAGRRVIRLSAHVRLSVTHPDRRTEHPDATRAGTRWRGDRPGYAADLIM